MNLMLWLSIGLILLIAILFAWLAGRAWRASRTWIKWPGTILSGLLAVVGLAIVVVSLVGLYRVYMPATRPAPDITVANDPEAVARGERLAQTCAGCHSSTLSLPLDGGNENFLGGLALLVPPNLTPGGNLQNWTDGEILRALREGIHKDGRSLLIMPSDQYHAMSDADAHAIIAYLRSQPAIEHDTPETQLRLLGTILIGLGIFPLSAQPPITAEIPHPPAGPNAEHGEYLVKISGCTECHGEDLQGGTSQFVPVGPNLIALIAQWDADEFVSTIRTGIDPYGNEVDPNTMPWKEYSAAFTDGELTAMYEYIRSLAETLAQ